MLVMLKAAIFIAGQPYKVGDKVEVDKKLGLRLIANGQASMPKAAPESAIAPHDKAETADLTDKKDTKKK